MSASGAMVNHSATITIIVGWRVETEDTVGLPSVHCFSNTNTVGRIVDGRDNKVGLYLESIVNYR